MKFEYPLKSLEKILQLLVSFAFHRQTDNIKYFGQKQKQYFHILRNEREIQVCLTISRIINHNLMSFHFLQKSKCCRF